MNMMLRTRTAAAWCAKAALAIVVMASLAGGLTSCKPAEKTSGEEVLVLCGGSMRLPITDIAERYKSVSDDNVVLSFGDSGTLCAQIQESGQGDVFVCHDPFIEWAQKQGLIDRWASVGRLDVGIVVPKGNPKNVQTLEDLKQPGLRIGIGDQTHSTAGVAVSHLLDKLPYGAEIRGNIRSETKGHQERCNEVVEGHIDAGLTWTAVAQLFADKLDIIPVPRESFDAISSATYGVSDLKNIKVTVGVTANAKDREAVAKFYDYATTQCKDIWDQYGFQPDSI